MILWGLRNCLVDCMYIIRGHGVRLHMRSATRRDGVMKERDSERGGKRGEEDGKDMRELPVQLH